MTETKEIAIVETPMQLLALATEQKMGVAEFERLIALQERWEANIARKAFFEAFTKFQASAPDIRKTKGVAFGDTSYKYAPLGDICRQLSESLQKAELSYRWEIQDDAKIKVTCLVSHVLGHTERTTMQSDPDASGKKNAIQARGSAIEYMKRYTLVGALGLSTTDTDTDGQGPNIDNYDMDRLHKDFMEIYNQVIQIDPKKSGWHPDNWKAERTGKNYVRAIGEIRKVLYELQPKNV